MMPEEVRHGVVDMDDDCVIEPQDYTGDYGTDEAEEDDE
jgi:hypothetical protein